LLATRTISLNAMNWLGDLPLGGDAVHEVAARVRSTRKPRPALLRATLDGAEVTLLDPEEGVAPGQACVLYDSAGPDARVLGGGTIRAAARPLSQRLGRPAEAVMRTDAASARSLP
jgi:tRNA-specific 2-thiouridylase